MLIKFPIFSVCRKYVTNAHMYEEVKIICKTQEVIKIKQESRAIARRTARCCCKFRYIWKSTASPRGFHCNNTAFKLHNSQNRGKATVLKHVYLLPKKAKQNSDSGSFKVMHLKINNNNNNSLLRYWSCDTALTQTSDWKAVEGLYILYIYPRYPL